MAGLGLEPRCPDTETHTLGNEPGQGSAGNTSESRGSRGVKMLVSMGLSCGHTDWSRWGWGFLSLSSSESVSGGADLSEG